MLIIVTRPAADAADFSGQLEALGHRVSWAPMLDVRFSPAELALDGVQAIVATSRNALRAIAASRALAAASTLPIFVVGPGSAQLAREIGFGQVTAGDGGAQALLPLIVATSTKADGPLLYLSGADVAFDLAPELQAAGFDIRRQVVYEAVTASELPGDVVRAIRAEPQCGVVLMSPRSAETFGRLMANAGLTGEGRQMTYFCLSAKVAHALQPTLSDRVFVTRRPSAEEMLALVKELASNRP